MQKKSTIEFQGQNDWLLWKVPSNILTAKMDIIVPFTHEVLVMTNGTVLETLGAGKHILQGDKNTDLYFACLNIEQHINWGTPNHFLVESGKQKFLCGAHGQFAYKVSNSRKLLTKVVGCGLKFTNADLANFSRPFALKSITSYLSKELTKKDSATNVSNNLTVYGQELTKILSKEFAEFGIEVISCIVGGVLFEQLSDTKQSIYCSECGAGLDNGICLHCAQKTVDFIRCKNCDNFIPKNDKHCRFCGKII